MPDRCRTFTKGGETQIDTVPPSAARLVVVGAPFYNMSTGGSNWCLLQCPSCGTYYDWDFEYEYLVNGSEDDTNITRLSPIAGARKADLVARHVAGSREKFGEWSPPQADALLHSPDAEVVRKAANWLFMAVESGNDLTPLLPQVLEAMKRPESQGDTVSTLGTTLFVYGSRKQANLERLKAAVTASGMESDERVQTTLRSCETLLRDP
jgi:hypothetical protein